MVGETLVQNLAAEEIFTILFRDGELSVTCIEGYVASNKNIAL